MALSNKAASRTLAVIGPAVSWLWLIGTMCVRLTSPTVGLRPTMPLAAAGQVIEPSVSVPIAMRTSPAATAAPLPLELPHGLRSSAQGLWVWPPTALQPEIEWFERMFAHSVRLVLPRMTAPAARSRVISGASRFVTLLARARLPAVVGSGPCDLDIVLDQDRLAAERSPTPDVSMRSRLIQCGRIERDHRTSWGSMRWVVLAARVHRRRSLEQGMRCWPHCRLPRGDT